jgi:hypothetical protein
MAPTYVGVFSMTNDSSLIDLDLVDKVVALVPQHTWKTVQEYIIDQLVDLMPSTVLEDLTGDPVGFDKAEAILYEYYNTHSNEDLITDAFKILGEENTLYMLDSLQLNKIPDEMPVVQ